MRQGGDLRKRVCLWLSGVALVVATLALWTARPLPGEGGGEDKDAG
jgi:hypothetical protein